MQMRSCTGGWPAMREDPFMTLLTVHCVLLQPISPMVLVNARIHQGERMLLDHITVYEGEREASFQFDMQPIPITHLGFSCAATTGALQRRPHQGRPGICHVNISR